MRKILISMFLLVSLAFSPLYADASVYVRGYTKSNGTYVAPYYRSSPNSTVYDNYSYKGNVNPYTGSVGTNTYGTSYSSPSYYYSTPKISKREKKVLNCQNTGKSETYCKSIYMKKKYK